MAKLFKTISLEERWKSSVYSGKAISPADVNQGAVDIRMPEEVKNSPTAQIKKLTSPVERNSALLKAMVATKKINTPPAVGSFNTTPLISFNRPFANTKFRSAINLANRLNQPQLGTTAHLAQYFLADFYTDYIKTVPFGVFNHTSDTKIQLFSFNPNQGGITPSLQTKEPNQGGLSPKVLEFNSLLAQGAIFVNGEYFTKTKTKISIEADGLIKDPNTKVSPSITSGVVSVNPKIQIKSAAKADKYITNPNTETPSLTSVEVVAQQQGIIQESGILGKAVSFIIPSIPTEVKKEIPSEADKVKKTQADVKQGGVDPKPITFQPNRTSPVLNVLGYELQRSLAEYTPRIIHGSADLEQPDFGADSIILGTESIDIDRIAQINVHTRINPNLITYIKNLKVESGRIRNWNYDNIGVKTTNNNSNIDRASQVSYPNIENIDSIPNQDSIIAKALGDPTNDSLESLASKVELEAQTTDKYPAVKTGINNYATLAYGQIRNREKNRQDSGTLTDFRSELPTQLTGGNGQQIKISDYTDNKTTKDRGVTLGDNEYQNDFINLKIESLRDNTTINFRAFLTSFSDSSTVNWNDINYVGRQDTLKAFKGYTRGGSIGFKIAALREEDMAFNYSKLNQLIKIAGVGAPSSTELYVLGPLCRITVGKWFRDTPVVFNSIKYDVQVADYSWDIDLQMPHLVDVSLDFAVLGDVTGKQLNSKTNDYLNYNG